VIRTRVGYAGGTTKHPTYHDIADHAETIQIEFDPAKITYAQLLDLFFNTHNACRAAWSRQYMSAVFYQGEEQKKCVLEAAKKKEAADGKVHTEISELKSFTVAEDYHQKYMLRCEADLMKEFEAIYPDPAEFRESTAAARVNAWLGHPNQKIPKSEVDRLGFSPEGLKAMQRHLTIDPAK
jgi:peptide-methionine (S)-S-oxide reductase